MILRASQLSPGMVCVGSGATIHRVVKAGVWKRDSHDRPTRERFPGGRVEVLVSYPGKPARVDYWNAGTRIQVNLPASVTNVTHEPVNA